MSINLTLPARAAQRKNPDNCRQQTAAGVSKGLRFDTNLKPKRYLLASVMDGCVQKDPKTLFVTLKPSQRDGLLRKNPIL